MRPQITLQGKPKRLAVLDYGLFQVHEGPRKIGICGFVIETDAEEVILIDTGFPEKYAVNADIATQEDALDSFGQVISVSTENLPGRQLAKLGLTKDDVTLMIQSHTHIDHIGDIAGYPQAPILMSTDERALPRPLYWAGKQPMDWPDREYHLINKDTVLGTWFEVLHCPSHAPGQLAFMVQLPQTGWIMMTSDAISRASEIDEKFGGSWNVERAIFHGDRLMRMAVDRDAYVIYGHSPEQWPTLKKAPEWFT
ncbi:MAG: MBL fold metallo-hydrolase [Sulfitobacter sp.]